MTIETISKINSCLDDGNISDSRILLKERINFLLEKKISVKASELLNIFGNKLLDEKEIIYYFAIINILEGNNSALIDLSEKISELSLFDDLLYILINTKDHFWIFDSTFLWGVLKSLVDKNNNDLVISNKKKIIKILFDSILVGSQTQVLRPLLNYSLLIKRYELNELMSKLLGVDTQNDNFIKYSSFSEENSIIETSPYGKENRRLNFSSKKEIKIQKKSIYEKALICSISTLEQFDMDTKDLVVMLNMLGLYSNALELFVDCNADLNLLYLKCETLLLNEEYFEVIIEVEKTMVGLLDIEDIICFEYLLAEALLKLNKYNRALNIYKKVYAYNDNYRLTKERIELIENK